MGSPFIGSGAIVDGALTPYVLRSSFMALYPNVYVPKGAEVTASDRARAAWLWSARRGIVAGQSAAALHGGNRRRTGVASPNVKLLRKFA